MSAMHSTKQIKKLNGVRQFNKYIFNHFTMLFAGRFLYGTDTDWCQNILAAKGCILTKQGSIYMAADPRILNAHDALPLLGLYWRLIFKLFKIEHYLTLQQS
jgi:hypothetical protein